MPDFNPAAPEPASAASQQPISAQSQQQSPQPPSLENVDTSNFDPAAFLRETAPPDESGFDPAAYLQQLDQEQYGTPEQREMAAKEAIGRGIITAPGMAFIEKQFGVPGEDIRGREKANPGTAALGEIGGLTVGMLTGTGEAALLDTIGKAAVDSAGLAKTVSIGGRLASRFVNQAAQMAVLQGGDEIARVMEDDPDVSAQSAISNVGLSAAIGGVTGVALGALSPLYKAAIGNRLAEEAPNMLKQLEILEKYPDMPGAFKEELEGMLDKAKDVRSTLYSEGEAEGGVKAQQIAKALPEISPRATERVDSQITNVLDKVVGALDTMQGDVKVGGKAAYLAQDLSKFTDIVDKPEATYADKFHALDEFKKTLQGYSKYGASVEDTTFGALTKKLAAEIKPMLEDEKVWGKAADIQKNVNAAVAKYIPAEKDMLSRFTTKVGGVSTVDQGKINTYLGQLGKPSAEIKQEMVKNFLDAHKEMVGTINDLFTKEGLDAPIEPVANTVLNHSIGKVTGGAKIINALVGREMHKMLGRTAAGAVGGAAGSVVGAPEVGALVGTHALGPLFSSVLPALMKPFSRGRTLAESLKSSVDYLMKVNKGQTALTKAAANVFKAGAAVLSTNLPDHTNREKLSATVDHFENNPDAIKDVDNGKISHYLPDHQTALTSATTQAISYLQRLKPQSYRPNPLDKEIEPSTAQIQRYNRALDIAQSPLIVLQHAKANMLQMSDIQDIQAMYPALYKQIAQKVSAEMTNAVSEEDNIPYKTRMGVSLLLGQPLDTSMQPASIMAAQPMPQPPQPPPAPVKAKRSKNSPSSLGKTTPLYQTPQQASEARNVTKD